MRVCTKSITFARSADDNFTKALMRATPSSASTDASAFGHRSSFWAKLLIHIFPWAIRDKRSTLHCTKQIRSRDNLSLLDRHFLFDSRLLARPSSNASVLSSRQHCRPGKYPRAQRYPEVGHYLLCRQWLRGRHLIASTGAQTLQAAHMFTSL